MKHIVMWMGNGNNEPGWAKILSNRGLVFLVQGSSKTPLISTWQNGLQTKLETTSPLLRWPLIDRVFFGFFSAVQLARLTLKHTRGEPIALLIADGPSGCLGLWMKWRRQVHTLVSMHSDYFPPVGTWFVRLHRCIIRALNRYVVHNADEVWRISPRIPTGKGHPRNYVVPVYINDNRTAMEERKDIVYLGVPSADHDLETLFEVARRHFIPLHIIGDSAYLRSIQLKAPPNTTFHGYLTDPERIKEIVKHCFCGYAVYRNTSPANYSYYGIPSKSFHYFASNVPVLTTNTAYFSQYIEKYSVGCVVLPDPAQIEAAILQMRDRYQDFYQAITQFRAEWNCNVGNFLIERMAVLL
jgi:glycosyltransferase involved in cell wall biosynthesis